MPELHYKGYQAGEKIKDTDIQAWADWEHHFFDVDEALNLREEVAAMPKPAAGKKKPKPKRKMKCPVNVKTIRSGALHHIKLLDKTLTTLLGIGLAAFTPNDDERHRGLVREEGIPPVLVLHLDEGSPAFAMCWFLSFHTKTRIVFIRDIFHREWNDVRLALGDSNAWWIVLLTTVVYNLPYGPWDSQAWWGKMQDASTDYQARAGPTSPLFMVLYEEICQDFKVTAHDTPQHRAQMFTHMAESKALTTKGAKVALRRWFSWVDAADQHDRVWNTRLLSLVLLGMVTGVYKDLYDVPLWKVQDRKLPEFADSEEEDEEEQDLGPAAEDEDIDDLAGQGVAPSDDKAPVSGKDELAALRKKCKNSLFVAVNVMCKDRMQHMVRIVSTMIRATREEHGRNAAACRDPESCKKFYIDAAKGKVFKVLEQSASLLQSHAALSYMGFITDFNVGIPARITVDHQLVKEQDDLAKLVMTIEMNQIKHRAGSMMYHYESWLGQMALGCSPDIRDRDKCIDKLYSDFKIFGRAKERSAKNTFLAKIVKASPFNFAVMEDVVYLLFGPHDRSGEFARAQFEKVCSYIFEGWGQTKVIEDNFKHMRDRETHDTTNKNHIPISYWSFAREMGAIESHKRAQVQSSEQTVLPERKIRKDLFDVQDHETSLPNTHAITERATWPTFSPQSSLHIYIYIYAGLVLLRMLDAESTWDVASRVRKGCLFKQGTIVRNCFTQEHTLCIAHPGLLVVLGWKVLMFEVQGGKKAFALGCQQCQNTEATWINPLLLDDYDVCPTTIVSPLHLWVANRRKVHENSGVVFLQSGDYLPIMEHAATQCFWQMPLTQLKTLIKELDLTPPTPDLYGHLSMLIKNYLNHLSVDELHEILAMRTVVPVDPMAEVLDASQLELVFNQDELKVVEDSQAF